MLGGFAQEVRAELLVHEDARLDLRRPAASAARKAVVDQRFTAATSAVWAAVSWPIQPNIFVWKEPRWSNGRMYSGRSYPRFIESSP